MEEFKYKVSVIVPVYNVEEYLRGCLDSLVSQTIDPEQMEILLINDGSTDNSLEICQEYAECYDNIKIFTQENSGPSVARNLGIQNAAGKYIMYLDSDDTLTLETVERVTNFFDQHYDEVDMVTILLQPYKGEKKLPLHSRYKYLTETGIYDLNELKNVFIVQTNMNIIIKNLFENNILFDTSMNYQEDQKYCCQILKDKMKLGFCKEAQYNYNRNDSSIVGTQSYALYMFEQSTKYFEDLFAQFEEVPQYFQALYFHDISWKLMQNCLLPFHYSPADFQQAIKRIKNLLNRVDVSVILQNTSLDNYQKIYWLRQKENSNLCAFIQNAAVNIYSNGDRIYFRSNIEVILRRILVKGHTVKIIGFFKSPIFSFTDDVEFYAIKNDREQEKLDVKLASSSYYKTKLKTETFWEFSYHCSIDDVTKLVFQVNVDGLTLDTAYWNAIGTAFYSATELSEYVVEDLLIQLKNNQFLFSKIDVDTFLEKRQKIANHFKNKSLPIYSLRKLAQKLQNKTIWLYYDSYTAVQDNGYFQFIHDFDKQDGIDRYYIITNTSNKAKDLFEDKHKPYLVPFGSQRHKELFLSASKILSSFIDHQSIWPFNSYEQPMVVDMFHAEIIYLQHGVLHAHLPWYYSPVGMEVDKVVVSSQFELENFSQNYGFDKEDLIPVGMARYDHINCSVTPGNKIIFAPSWRGYLLGGLATNGDLRTSNNEKFLQSTYFKNILEFLNEERLDLLLKKYDLILDVKLHPEFYVYYKDLVTFTSDRVHLAENQVKLEEYKLFITDFSSFVFDYAYLNRPIIYFVPDYVEFISGMNHYRELDLPFEKAFGNLTITSEKAIDEIERIIQNQFVPDEIFKKRMSEFYLPMENCAESLYQYLMKQQ